MGTSLRHAERFGSSVIMLLTCLVVVDIWKSRRHAFAFKECWLEMMHVSNARGFLPETDGACARIPMPRSRVDLNVDSGV